LLCKGHENISPSLCVFIHPKFLAQALPSTSEVYTSFPMAATRRDDAPKVADSAGLVSQNRRTRPHPTGNPSAPSRAAQGRENRPTRPVPARLAGVAGPSWRTIAPMARGTVAVLH
jgi:hypothetical protein